jgi:cell division septation protein DedD
MVHKPTDQALAADSNEGLLFNVDALSHSDNDFLAELDQALAIPRPVSDGVIAAVMTPEDITPSGEQPAEILPSAATLSRSDPDAAPVLESMVAEPQPQIGTEIVPSHRERAGSWSQIPLLFALLGMAVAIWQIRMLDERLSRLEVPGHPAENSALIAEVTALQQQIGLLQAASSGPDAENIKQARVIAALKSELATATEHIQALQSSLMVTERRFQRAEQQLMMLTLDVAHWPITTPSRVGQAVAVNASEQLPSVTKAHPPVDGNKPHEHATLPVKAPPAAPPKALAHPVAAEAAKSGDWIVNLASFRQQQVAEQELARLTAQQPVHGHIVSTNRAGQAWYRVVVSFPDVNAAKSYANTMRTKPGFSSVWISRD